MKNGLLLCAASFFACAWPAASLAAAAGSQIAHAAPAAHARTQSSAAHKQAPVAPLKVAPADEYFGHQKLSILGVNNTIHDTNARIGFDHPHAAKYYGTLAAAEDALQDWAHKYPQDTWLPGRAYYMSHVFWQMHTSDGDAAASRCRALLFKQFPKSHWAVLAKKETRDSVAPSTATDIATQGGANTTASNAATINSTAANTSAALPAGATNGATASVPAVVPPAVQQATTTASKTHH